MEVLLSMKVDTIDADTITLIPKPGAVLPLADFTNIVIEFGSARDANLFPADDAEYDIIIRRK